MHEFFFFEIENFQYFSDFLDYIKFFFPFANLNIFFTLYEITLFENIFSSFFRNFILSNLP